MSVSLYVKRAKHKERKTNQQDRMSICHERPPNSYVRRAWRLDPDFRTEVIVCQVIEAIKDTTSNLLNNIVNCDGVTLPTKIGTASITSPRGI